MIPYSRLNALIYIPYPRVNCLKTTPFTAAHTYIAHIWQYPPAGRLHMVAVRSMNRDNPSHSVLKYNSSNSKLTARLNELYTMSSTLLAREIDHVE